MHRRQFLAATAATAALAALPGRSRAAVVFDPQPGPWRTFTVTTALDIRKPDAGPVQAWVPLPSIKATDWSLSVGETWSDDWSGNAETADLVTDPTTGTRLVHATFADTTAAPRLQVVSHIRTRDRGDTLATTGAAPLASADRDRFLAATDLMPTDGIVKETADHITAGVEGDEARARALYDWVVEKTERVADVRGCGLGDVATMLQSGHLGGKCADLNALYVALARASGLPARDLYGIRMAPSAFGYKSLGAGSATITKSQHCRAEVFLDGPGWVPVDPADVRKVVLEEPPGNNALASDKVMAARAGLFGAWEGNWMAYNDAHDVTLPGSEHQLPFLMYPQAEVAGVLLDCLAPDTFAYTITAAEITA